MMRNGQEVWLAFATERGSDGNPMAFVRKATVLDAENMIVKREGGCVTVISQFSSETIHYTEAAAWRACADRLNRAAHAIEEEAAGCMRRAGSLASAEAANV